MRNLLRAEIWKTLNGAKISQELSAEIIRKYGAEKAEAIKTLLSGHQVHICFWESLLTAKLPKNIILTLMKLLQWQCLLPLKKSNC